VSDDQPPPVDNLAIASPGADATVKLGKMLDGKFKVLTVLEADVDSYTLEALRVLDERAVVVRLLKPSKPRRLEAPDRSKEATWLEKRLTKQ